MDDPEEDWKIEEYSSSNYIEEEEEEGKSNIIYIMEKGLSLGKKVVITGFVISSAPLVLPSVVVVSAIGFAFAVPFGLVFASYTCTQKLMSKLLPMPTTTPMLEYDEMFEDEDRKEFEQEKEDEIEYSVEMEEEEKEQMKDIREGVEERIELVKNELELPQEDDNDIVEIRDDDEKRLAAEDGSLIQKGYEEEDDDNSSDRKEERADSVIDVQIEGVGDKIVEEAVEDGDKVEEPLPEMKQRVDMVSAEKRSDNGFGKEEGLLAVAKGIGEENRNNQRVLDNEEEKDLKEGSVGLLEKIRDEGYVADAAKKKKKKKKKNKGGSGKSHVEMKDNCRNDGIMKVLEKPIENEDEHLETLVQMPAEESNKAAKTSLEEQIEREIETEAMSEDKNKELQKIEKEGIRSDKTNRGDESIGEEVKPAVEMEGIILEKRGLDSRDHIVAREFTMDYSTLIHGEHAGENGHSTLEKETLVESKEPEMQQHLTSIDVGSDLNEDLIHVKEDKTTIHPIGETKGTAAEMELVGQSPDEVHNGYQGNKKATDSILNENVLIVEIPVTGRKPETEHNNRSYKVDSEVPLEKESVLSEDKIWEQIDALRTIVGYGATPHRSIVDEVRALYIFTGVEPPSLFGERTDVAGLNNKLRFLMSIVGVK